MKRLLTDAKVKNLKPKDKPYKTADGGGLYVYTTKAGAKSFRYDFKFNSKWGTITFGTYPEITLADAREQHQQARELLAKDKDPRQQNQNNQGLKPFSYYALETVKTLELQPVTETKRLSRSRKYLFPVLDKKKVTDITAIDLLNLLKPIAEKGARETARVLATYCRQTFDTLLSMQLIENNPAESINRLLPKPKPSTNFAHITDPKELGMVLKAIDSYDGDYSIKQALKFATLAILRPHNIRFLKWEYIDFQERVITYPPDQMKMGRTHKVPLSDQSLTILNDMKRLTHGHEYVFLSARGQRTGKPMSENTLNQALIRTKHPDTGKPLGRGVITSHGLRHTASTFLNEMRFSTDAIELQLSHASKDRIRATYNKAELMPERAKMMQAWADYLDGLRAVNNITPLKKGA